MQLHLSKPREINPKLGNPNPITSRNVGRNSHTMLFFFQKFTKYAVDRIGDFISVLFSETSKILPGSTEGKA